MRVTDNCIEGLSGRYSLRGEVEIEGTVDGLTVLSQSLRTNTQEIKLPLRILSTEDVRPYDWSISSIELQLSQGKVKIKIYREGDSLVISGALKYMAALADDVDFLVNQGLTNETQGVQHHSHIEFYEGHFWLDPESQAIVITYLE
ncbi:MAG TPA: hypothetical protein PKD12_20365 [Nitrospira sp.]|nr:hypothetical protein [Nitrospira sp.]